MERIKDKAMLYTDIYTSEGDILLISFTYILMSLIVLRFIARLLKSFEAE